jgi:hypothetical protein
MTDVTPVDLGALLKAKLGNQYGQATIDLVAILLPPLKKLGLAEIGAVLKALAAKDTDAALVASYAAMTNEELVAAKQKLADLLTAAASDNADLVASVKAFLLKAVEVALGIALLGF